MNRKKKFRLGCLSLIAVLLLVGGFWFFIDTQRSPGPNMLLERSDLVRYIPVDADVVLYVRDLTAILNHGARHPALSLLYAHFVAPAVQRLDGRLPVVSTGWLVRGLFGNECVAYIGHQGELGLVSKTRVSAQLLLRALWLLKPLIVPEYVDPSGQLAFKTKSSRYPTFYLQLSGSLLLAGSKLPAAGTRFYPAETQPPGSSPDVHVCITDHTRLLDIIPIRENHPLWSLVHLIMDRQISVVNGRISAQGLVLDLFSSSTARELNANAAKLEQYRHALPEEVPFVCSYRGPDRLSISDGQAWLGTQRLGSANPRLNGLDIRSPVHVFLKEQNRQPGAFVLFRSRAARDVFSARALKQQTPPLYLTDCNDRMVLSNTAATDGICTPPFQTVDTVLPAPERVYAYLDLLETYNLLKPYILLAARDNPSLTKPLSLLDTLHAAEARIRLYVYTSKRESLAELILQ